MKPLPGNIRAEVEKGARAEITATRSYREVNQMNREKDGMANLNKADPGFNSKVTPASSRTEAAYAELDTDMSY